MISLPELELEDQERKHIEEVIQKAEYRQPPYTVRQMPPTPPFLSYVTEWSSFEVGDLPGESESSFAEVQEEYDVMDAKKMLERDVTPPKKLSTIAETSVESSEMSLEELERNRKLEKLPKIEFEEVEDALEVQEKTLEMAGDQVEDDSYREKPYSSLIEQENFLSQKKSLPAEEQLSSEELEQIARIAKLAEMDASTSIYEPKSELELSEDELEHIRRVTAMAEHEEIAEKSPAIGQTPIPAAIIGEMPIKTTAIDRSFMSNTRFDIRLILNPDLSEEEVERIIEEGERISAMAELQGLPTRIPFIAEKSTTAPAIGVMPIPATSIGKMPMPTPIFEPELSEDELEHIRKVTAMAELEGKPMKVQTIGKTPTGTSSIGILPIPVAPSEPELSEEELEHIRRVTAMAELEEIPTRAHYVSEKPLKRESIGKIPVEKHELTDEELEHIRKITEIAQLEDFSMKPAPLDEMPMPGQVVAEKPIQEPELTQEELEHIRRITEMAALEETYMKPKPIVAPQEPELTLEELEHIRKISEMAELDGEKPILLQSIEPELSAEELEHIRKITSLVEETISPATSLTQKTPQISPIKEQTKTTFSFSKFGLGKLKDVTTNVGKQLAEVADVKLIQEKVVEIAKTRRGSEESRKSLEIEEKVDLEEKLTREELEHIRRIQEQAEKELEIVQKPPIVEVAKQPEPIVEVSEQPEFTALDLGHIRKIQGHIRKKQGSAKAQISGKLKKITEKVEK